MAASGRKPGSMRQKDSILPGNDLFPQQSSQKRRRHQLQQNQATYTPQRRRKDAFLDVEPVTIGSDPVVFDLENEMYADSLGDYSGTKIRQPMRVKNPIAGSPFEQEFLSDSMTMFGVNWKQNNDNQLLGKLEKS